MVPARLLLFAVCLGAAVSTLFQLKPLSAQATVTQAATTPASVPVANAPKVIFLFRHAEKPDGDKTDPNLTPVGFRRADALPTLFVPQPDPAQPGAVTTPRLPRPDAIFATAMSKHSNRPVETVTPLARTLHEQINTRFEDRDSTALAEEVLSGRYAGKVVVICWHHGEIPHVAMALGVADAPATWNPDTFNQIWKIEYSNGVAHMTVLPQALLPGDPAAH